MADEILNPGDAASQRELLNVLRGLEPGLARVATEAVQAGTRDIAREIRAAGARARREPAARRVAGIGTQTPAEQRQSVTAAQGIAAAEERAANAAERRARASATAARAERDAARAAAEFSRLRRLTVATPLAGTGAGGLDLIERARSQVTRFGRETPLTFEGMRSLLLRQQAVPTLQRQAQGALLAEQVGQIRNLSNTSRALDTAFLQLQRRIRPQLALPGAGQTTGGFFGGLFPAEVRARAVRGIQTPGINPTAEQIAALAGLGAGQSLYDVIGRGTPIPFPIQQARGGVRPPTAGPAVGPGARDMETELQRLTRLQAMAGDEMRRHGLLTTEFISALAAGRVTVRELGVQVGGTIAKFAGWTIAATATYGAAAALGQVAKGAYDAAGGINELTRFAPNLDMGQQRQQMRDLATRFNLPIGQVAQVTAQATRYYQEQGQVADVTTAALYGLRIGNLDAAQSARFATSVVRGFRLETSDLGDVINVVNQLQNKMGVDFGQTAQGVAQAAGSFGAAGGNFKQLASFLTAGQLVTGRTGPEIATILRRASGTFRRPERRQRIIDLLGIDPADNSITKILLRGIEVAGGRGDQARRIAEAISTPDLAARGLTAILQSGGAYFENAMYNAANSANSARKELEVLKRAPAERLQRLVVDLQNIGSALSEAGAFQGVQGLAEVLHLGLSAGEGLVGVFNQLPQPARETALYVAQIAGAIALMRRFDVGGLFREGGALQRGLGRPEQQRVRAEILQGLQDEQRVTVTEMQGRSREASRLQYRAIRHASRGEQVLARFGPESEEYIAHQARLLALQQQATDATRDAEDLLARRVHLTQQEREFGRRTTRRGGEGVFDVAHEMEIAYLSSILPRPGLEGPQPLFGRGGVYERSRAAEIRRRFDLPQGTTLDEKGLGLSLGQRVGVAMEGAGDALKEGGKRFGEQARNLSRSILSSLDAVDLAFVGAVALFEAVRYDLSEIGPDSATNRIVARAREGARIDDLNKAQAAVRQATRRGTGQQVIDLYQRAVSEGGRLLSLITMQGFDRPTITPGERVAATRRQDLAELQAIQRAQAYARQRGLPLPGQTRSQIEDRMRRAIRGGTDPDKALQDALLSAGATRGLLTAQTPKELRDAQANIKQFKERLKRVAEEEGKTAAEIDYQEVSRLFNAATQRLLSRTTDPLVQARDSFRRAQRFLGITRAAQEAGGADQADVDQAIADRNRARQGLFQARLARGDLRARELQSRTADPVVRAKEQVQRATRRIAQIRAAIERGDASEEDLLNALLERNDAQRQLYQGRQARFDARTARLQSETADPVAAAQILVERTNRNIERTRRAVERGDAARADIDTAITNHNNAIQQLSQASMSQFQAGQSLAASRFALSNVGGDPANVLRNAITVAQNNLTNALAQPNVDPTTIIGLQQAVVDARRAFAENALQQAEAMVQARANYDLAGMEDPVQIASRNVRLARDLLRFATTPAERVQRQADVRQRVRERRTTIYTEKLNDIEFDAEIGRIDRDVEIRRLEGLLRTIRGNRDLRRQIRLRIHQLRQELDQQTDQFRLDVGNIKLPTIYEIRRAIQGGLNPARQVTMTHAPTVNVYPAPGREGQEVGSLIAGTLSTSTRSALRAGGL